MSTSRIGPSAAAVAGEPLVTAVVPRAFVLTLKFGVEVAVPAGLQELPQSIAENWYSKANGVTIYEPSKPAGEEADSESDEATDETVSNDGEQGSTAIAKDDASQSTDAAVAVKRGPGRPPKAQS